MSVSKSLAPALSAGCAIAATLGTAQGADVAVGARIGTLGLGAEVIAGTPVIDVRAGYGAFNYNRSVSDADATYDGQLKLRNASFLFDWHPQASWFALTVGAVGSSDRADIHGVPNGNTFTLDGAVYSTTEVGSVTGHIKPGHSVQPYVGLGFGNPLSGSGKLHLLVDLGVAFMGEPQVDLTAHCAATLPTVACAQAQQSAVGEEANVRDHVNDWKAWPVVNIGLAYQF